MPRGVAGIRKASADIEARKNSGGDFPRATYFKLAPNETALVRFLEEDEDIAWIYVHNVDVPGRAYPDQIPCLDQEDEDEYCPGCEKELPRKFKGFINLIWFDGPVYKRDENKRIVKKDGEPVVVGEKTQNALWSSGPNLFDQLAEADETYKGLRSRRFIVKRKGKGLDTKYIIKPEDIDSGKQKFDDEERELDAQKYDLNAFMAIPDADEFEDRMNGGRSGGYRKKKGSDEDAVSSSKSKNPFMKRR